MQEESTDTNLDDETQRLLEANLREPIQSFATECHDAIRADAYESAREARANGHTPEEAADYSISPDYLQASEELWLRTFVFDDGPRETVAKRIATVCALVLLAMMALFPFMAFDANTRPDILSGFIYVAPVGLWYAATPLLKAWIRKTFGPTGCAFLAPGVGIGMYCSLFGVIGLFFFIVNLNRPGATPGGIAIVVTATIAFIIIGGWAYMAINYFEMRSRIKDNYRAVVRILELSDG